MLNAFASLKFLEKCYHNVQKPTLLIYEASKQYNSWADPFQKRLISNTFFTKHKEQAHNKAFCDFLYQLTVTETM